jgi:hypothetical protein
MIDEKLLQKANCRRDSTGSQSPHYNVHMMTWVLQQTNHRKKRPHYMHQQAQKTTHLELKVKNLKVSRIETISAPS